MKLALCSVILTLNLMGWAYVDNRQLAYFNAFLAGVFLVGVVVCVFKEFDDYMNGK